MIVVSPSAAQFRQRWRVDTETRIRCFKKKSPAGHGAFLFSSKVGEGTFLVPTTCYRSFRSFRGSLTRRPSVVGFLWLCGLTLFSGAANMSLEPVWLVPLGLVAGLEYWAYAAVEPKISAAIKTACNAEHSVGLVLWNERRNPRFTSVAEDHSHGR
jgi:hypothetical protein